MNSIDKVSQFLSNKEKASLHDGQPRNDGSLSARERVLSFLDSGSFIESGTFMTDSAAESPAAGVIAGYGTVDGRLVFVYSQDPAVYDGAYSKYNMKKICSAYDAAAKMGAPIIGMLDSNGVKIEDGIFACEGFGNILRKCSEVSGVIPNISIVFGNCAGGAAVAAAMSDFVIINKVSGRMFVTGPSVTEALTGNTLPSDAEGNLVKSGNAHIAGDSDIECIEKAKILLSYLPSNNLSDPFVCETDDDLNRTSEALRDMDSIDDIRIAVSEVADDKAFFEIQEGFAPEIRIGFIRMNGSAVGAIANSKKSIGGRSAEKCARFIRFCDAFNIPLLTFTDTDGFVISAEEEIMGLAGKAAQLMYAFSAAAVPKVNVITGACYKTAGIIFNSKASGADIVFAYPFAGISALPPETGVGILYSERLKNGESREALAEEYSETEASVYNAAQKGIIDDIIDPAQTRQRVIASLEMLASKRVPSISRKHDNMPL